MACEIEGNVVANPGSRNLTLAILTLIYVFNFMDRQIMGVLAEPIKQELDLSDSQLGLLTGFMFAIFYTSLGVPVAWLADRTRRTWVIAGACALWSGFSALCGLATGFFTMAAARIGVAVGEAGGTPPSYSMIADLFPHESRARALALYSLGVPIGLGAGTALGGWIAASYGWRAAFFCVAAPGLLLSALLLIFGREPERGGLETGAGPHDHAPVSLGKAIALFLTSPLLMTVSLSCALGAFACYSLMGWLSAYLIRVLGMTLSEIGTWLSIAIAIGMGIGLWASGVLSDRLGARDQRMYAWIPAAALGIGAPVLLAATMMDDWRLATPLFGVALGLSIFYLVPSVTAVQQIVSPDQRSTASALLLLFINIIGLGIGPLFVGVISDLSEPRFGDESLRIAFFALAPMFLAAMLANLASARLLGRQADMAALRPITH